MAESNGVANAVSAAAAAAKEALPLFTKWYADLCDEDGELKQMRAHVDQGTQYFNFHVIENRCCDPKLLSPLRVAVNDGKKLLFEARQAQKKYADGEVALDAVKWAVGVYPPLMNQRRQDIQDRISGHTCCAKSRLFAGHGGLPPRAPETAHPVGTQATAMHGGYANLAGAPAFRQQQMMRVYINPSYLKPVYMSRLSDDEDLPEARTQIPVSEPIKNAIDKLEKNLDLDPKKMQGHSIHAYYQGRRIPEDMPGMADVDVEIRIENSSMMMIMAGRVLAACDKDGDGFLKSNEFRMLCDAKAAVREEAQIEDVVWDAFYAKTCEMCKSSLDLGIAEKHVLDMLLDLSLSHLEQILQDDLWSEAKCIECSRPFDKLQDSDIYLDCDECGKEHINSSCLHFWHCEWCSIDWCPTCARAKWGRNA